MRFDRRPFADAWEGDCLPSGAYAVPLADGTVATHLGPLAGPGEGLRYITITEVGGFKLAAQGQTTPATWEWVQGEWTDETGTVQPGRWFDRGGSSGTCPCVYDADGNLHIIRPGPDVTSQGYRYLAPNGELVLGDATYNDPVRQLSEYSVAGPYVVGQGWQGGVLVLLGGVRYVLEPGDTHTVRARSHDAVLAVATRKLTEGETVLLWADVEAVLERPAQVLVRTPPIVIEAPPVVSPVPPPPGGPVSAPNSWDNPVVHNSSYALLACRETGSVTRVEIRGDGFKVWFTTLSTWPKTYPGGMPDVGDGDPIVFTSFVGRVQHGRTHVCAMAMDAHDQPGEHISGPPLREWDSAIFYIGDGGAMKGPIQDGEWIGFGAAHGACRLEYAKQRWPGQLDERTNMVWVPAREGVYDFAVREPPVVVQPPPVVDPPPVVVQPPVVVAPPVIVAVPTASDEDAELVVLIQIRDELAGIRKDIAATSADLRKQLPALLAALGGGGVLGGIPGWLGGKK